MIYSDIYFYLIAACMLLLLPMEWILSLVTAALFHEFCHVLVLKIFRGKVRSVSISARGCEIETDPMGDMQNFLSVLAGPVGSFLLLALREKFPMIAACGFLQGIYNLLPVLPLDGGRILNLLLCRFCPNQTHTIMQWVAILTCITVIFAAILSSFLLNTGYAPILLALLLSIRILPRKIPCKPS